MKCPHCNHTISYDEIRSMVKELPEDIRRWLRGSLAASVRETFGDIRNPTVFDSEKADTTVARCPHCDRRLTFIDFYHLAHSLPSARRMSLYASISVSLRKVIGLGTGKLPDMTRPRCKCQDMTLTRFKTRKRCYGCEELEELMRKGMTLKQARQHRAIKRRQTWEARKKARYAAAGK